MKDLTKNPFFYYVLVTALVALWPLLLWAAFLPKAQEKLEADRLAMAELLEAERLAEELRLKANTDNVLNKQFAALTGEQDYEKSNNIINNILPMFASKDVPVLVIISEENGMKDYDKPTTIDMYLNYLKDRKAYKAEVENIIYDDSGKIKELELRKIN